MLNWFKKISVKKANGLDEMKEATQRKIEVAQKILDRRQDERRKRIIKVEDERRGHLNGEIIHVS